MDTGVPLCVETPESLLESSLESSREEVTLQAASAGAVRVCHRIGCGRGVWAEGAREG